MFSDDDKRRIYSCCRYLVKVLQPKLACAERRLAYEWMTKATEDGCFEEKEEGMHRIHGLIVQLEVACLVTKELGLDASSALAVLLYRPFLRGTLRAEQITDSYGAEVVRLLQLLARTSELYMRKEAISSENFHNLLISMAEDMRVVLIIIADRLYLLRHAQSIYTAEAREELASEISFLYAPIAHRLGLYTIKGEMEDLCLKYLQPKTYGFITRKLGETKAARDAYIAEFITPVKARLREELGIPFEMKGRVKSISSINNKLKKLPFEDIYDVFAIRVILDVPLDKERQACWQVYSIITDMYRPNPERLKDWISIPKSNGYESLHTTVLGPGNRWVEVQIRTKRMDAIAERGVAAHWRYKGIKSEHGLDDFLASVREALESVQATSQEEEKRQTLESSLLTLKAREIYVFTPKGEILKLPQGATLLDFAFMIHSRVGARAISGKVNGKNVSLRHQLSNGDSVEVITSPQQSPKLGWLSIVVSPKAKAKIRQLLRAEEEAGIGVAKELIRRRIKNRKLPFHEAPFIRVTQRKGYKSLSDFYRDLTHDRLDVQEFLILYEQELEATSSIEAQPAVGASRSAEDFIYTETETEARMVISSTEVLILDRGLTGVAYSLAQCCHPVYGDEVFGLVTSRGIKVHRTSCPNAPDMFAHSPHKIICAKWNGDEGRNQVISLEVVGRDELAIATNITSLIRKEAGIKLRSYSIHSEDGLFHGSFVLHVERREALTLLLKKVRNASGVKHAELIGR